VHNLRGFANVVAGGDTKRPVVGGGFRETIAVFGGLNLGMLLAQLTGMKAVWMVLLSSAAWAAPGDLSPVVGAESREPLQLIAGSAERTCSKAGAVCFFAAARTTIAVESGALATAPPTAGKKVAPVVPRFARAASLAGTHITGPAASGSWAFELATTLKRSAYAGNVVFLLFDADDPEALEARQFTALYQASVKAGNKLAARLTLSPDEGFRAGHTYRLRVVQLISDKEILLAEGDVTLL
jgi:hypothetical protein